MFLCMANFLHKLRNIKYEHFDSGIDLECFEKCLSQLNNSSYLDARSLLALEMSYRLCS